MNEREHIFPFFQEILTSAGEHDWGERATHHVPADPARVPLSDPLADSELREVLTSS